MNEQQPYERHLAEKFQQLPLPDVEPNWQQMKLLLDKEMPRGGGYWRWITGLGILLLMLGGTWFFISRKDSGDIAQVVKEHPVTTEKQESSSPAADRTSAKANEKKADVPAQDNTSVIAADESLIKSPNTKTIDENLPNSSDNNNPGSSTKVNSQNDKSIPVNRDQHTPENNDRVRNEKSADLRGSDEPLRLNRQNIPGNRDPQDKSGSEKSALASSINAQDDFIKNARVQYEGQKLFGDIEVDKLIRDSIKRNYSEIFPDAGLDQSSGKLSGKTKSAKPTPIESVQNRVVAVGLSLPMGFPLGDQKPGAYNINARPNTISDFLPVPHLQYHINNKVYLQTEVQLMNPQFIQPVLLFQNKTEFPSTNTVHYNSVYARKLYYFNLPVGIHYSPFPHFYLGTGLQFSSLVSGVAMHEETSFVIGSGQYNLLSQRYSKFKNDSISNRIDNSEFRLMLDANYYWRQFTVGLRYNQALSNYVSFRLNNVTPLFTDKNKSLQFYLRYNLWEDYRRSQKSGVRSQRR